MSIEGILEWQDNIVMRYLAVDIGASSGKIIAAELKEGRIASEVTYRFANGISEKNGHLVWDLGSLFASILEGLCLSGKSDFVSIDTWGVDFVLLDKEGSLVSEPVSYRDSRTERISSMPDQGRLYSRTGIQFQRFNTVYQLLAIKQQAPEVLDKAEHMLFIPDYLNYLLTGRMCQEFTEASTSNLLLAGTKEWDREIIRELGFPERLFGRLSLPGTLLGRVEATIAERIGYSPEVILAPSHDTASAVYGSLADDTTAFLSSGTWSLFGCLSKKAETGDEARSMNFTNEGGRNGDIRFLRNIMGTWMLQGLKRDYDDRYTFKDIEERARASEMVGYIDPTDQRFLAPSSMKEEILRSLQEQGLVCPEDIGTIANVVYHSLAREYGRTVRGMEKILGRRFVRLNIVGGGSKDMYLDELAGRYTGLEVYAGPGEGTAIGNILSAMVASGEVCEEEKNGLVARSFEIKKI